MDYKEDPPSVDAFWSIPLLQEWITLIAFHTQGHTPRCGCPWCKQSEHLRIIMNRPDLLHGDHCVRTEGPGGTGGTGGSCWHERYVENARRKRSKAS